MLKEETVARQQSTASDLTLKPNMDFLRRSGPASSQSTDELIRRAKAHCERLGVNIIKINCRASAIAALRGIVKQ